MERFTISLDGELLAAFDAYIECRSYQNRSEAVRDLIRDALESFRVENNKENGECVACLSYIYDHHERELARRLVQIQHNHHDLTVSSMHAHLDHDSCLETVILKGDITLVRKCADEISAETGVHHGKLNLIPVNKMAKAPHSHHTNTRSQRKSSSK